MDGRLFSEDTRTSINRVDDGAVEFVRNLKATETPWSTGSATLDMDVFPSEGLIPDHLPVPPRPPYCTK